MYKNPNYTYNSSINIFQWNARGLISKKGEILNLINAYDILTISESWLESDNHFSVQGYQTFRKDSSIPKSSGLCTLVKNSISAYVSSEVISINGFVDTLAINIRSVQGNILIVSLYKHPSFRIKYEHWESFSNLVTPTNKKLLF